MVSKPYKNQPLIVIVGETSSGKSALAMYLAQQFTGEIIAADAWTVYKGFDIGTAKPSVEDQALVSHHLVDVANPSEGFSAAEFKFQAQSAINDIHARKKLPIVVGGSGLYVDSLLYDYSFAPKHNQKEREILNGMTLEQLLDQAAKMQLDTSLIDVRNKRRVIRLIENKGQMPGRQALRDNTLIIGVSIPAEVLAVRARERVAAMLARGLEREVRDLALKYGWNAEPMKGVGYREFQRYIAGEMALDELKQEIYMNTMKLAKKQRTWFKRNKSIQWISKKDDAVDLVTTFLNK